MKKSLIRHVVLALIIAASFSFTGTAPESPKMITICHNPPGNIANCHEITISLNAFLAHTEHHGDGLVCYNQSEVIYYNYLADTYHMPLTLAY